MAKKKRARIVVVGSANVDLTTFTDQFPKAGETLFGKSFDLGFGGKGANQAVAAAYCGADAHMVARVGDDLFGPATIGNFKSLGIGAKNVKMVKGVSSGVAPIFVQANGQNRILVVKGANDELTPKAVKQSEAALQESGHDRHAVRDPARDHLLHREAREKARHPRDLEPRTRDEGRSRKDTKRRLLHTQRERGGGDNRHEGKDGPPTRRSAPNAFYRKDSGA